MIKGKNQISFNPVVVRVTFNRNNTTFNTGIRVHCDQWDSTLFRVRPTHPNCEAYNKTISDYYSKIQNLAFTLISENTFSFAELKVQIDNSTKVPKIEKKPSFKLFSDQLVIDMLSVNQAGLQHTIS